MSNKRPQYERLIKTINERLRTNNKIIVSKDNSGISEILFARRMYPSANEKTAYEKSTGFEPNTIKKLVTEPFGCISDRSTVTLSDTDFESGQDSTILVRERTRGTKLEGAYKKRKGTLLEQTNHTITFLSAGSNKSTIISKRDVGNTIEENNKPCCSREATRLEEIRKYSERTLPGEFTNDDNQASDQNKLDSDDSTSLQNSAEQQRMPKLTEEPVLPTLPEQKKKQEPAMKGLRKKVKKMKKNKKPINN